MNGLVNYIIASISYMLLFYLFYITLLSRDTTYRRNRIYLLSTLLLSLLLPLVTIRVNSPVLAETGIRLQEIISLGEITITPGSISTEISSTGTIFLTLYLVGFIISASLLAAVFIRLLIIKRRGTLTGPNIISAPLGSTSGFSAMGLIFINSDLDQGAQSRIIEHEKKHIRHNHFNDLLFIRIIGVIFWFNPLVYLYLHALKSIHEFQVDAEIIETGEDITNYRRLIMNQIFRTELFTIQSAFSGHTPIKKRFIMMTKEKSGKLSGLKLLALLPAFAAMFMLFSCTNEVMDEEGIKANEEITSNDFMFTPDTDIKPASAPLTKSFIPEGEFVFYVVENMPTFQGGDVIKFRDWVQSNVVYPDIAKENGIQGIVFVQFVVSKEGKVGDISVTRSVDPSLDNEVIKTIANSPSWTPGFQRNEAANVRFSVAVKFQLD